MINKLFFRTAFLTAILAIATVVQAQQTVNAGDIQRLQDQVHQAGSEVSRLRSSDPNLASRLENELDDLSDEIVYLKVKLRKEGSVNRTEYSDLRDRLQDIRGRARGDASTTSSAPSSKPGGVSGGVSGAPSGGVSDGSSDEVYDTRRPTQRSGSAAIPEGQEIDARLETELSSDTAQVEDRFEATTAANLYEGNNILIPAGSRLRGVVSSVNRASRTDRKGSLTVVFDQITVNGRTYPMRGTVTQALESEGIRGEAGRIGAGAGVGAIIGGILGGVKGALLGVLIGGGGTIAATEGKDVTLPPGTILRVRLDQPPNIR
jgi:type IV secretory pathway VirB10-like protein